MTKETKNSDHQEGFICEEFVYFLELMLCPDSLDINELCEIVRSFRKINIASINGE